MSFDEYDEWLDAEAVIAEREADQNRAVVADGGENE